MTHSVIRSFYNAVERQTEQNACQTDETEDIMKNTQKTELSVNTDLPHDEQRGDDPARIQVF